MTILAFGINHKTAPLSMREKISVSPDILSEALHDITQQSGIDEAAILSTCNRTEIYCSLDVASIHKPIDWFSQFKGLPQAQLLPFLYTHPDAGAVKHVLRVASGLDSMVLGEPQVLGQLKSAYHTALQSGSIGKLLSRLFQHSFMVAKEIRATTSISAHPVSIAFAAVRLAQQIFGDISNCTALLIGAGNTIELTTRHLRKNGLSRIIIANRTLQQAQRLSAEYSAYAISLKDIPQHLAEADIVITATASPTSILSKATVEQAIKTRKRRPVFMVDITVPRDIDPKVGELQDVYLYTIDDLQAVIHDNIRTRKSAVKQAEEIIDNQVEYFMHWLSSLDTVDVICALRQRAESIQKAVLTTAQRKLNRGEDPQLVLQEATRLLTNKILHAPISQLRKANAENKEELVAVVRELLDLKS